MKDPEKEIVRRLAMHRVQYKYEYAVNSDCSLYIGPPQPDNDVGRSAVLRLYGLEQANGVPRRKLTRRINRFMRNYRRVTNPKVKWNSSVRAYMAGIIARIIVPHPFRRRFGGAR